MKKLKLWHTIAGLIISIIIHSLSLKISYFIPLLGIILYEITPYIIIFWIVMIFYVSMKNNSKPNKGTGTRAPQGGDYRSEAWRACEKITPKKTEQNAFNFKD